MEVLLLGPPFTSAPQLITAYYSACTEHRAKYIMKCDPHTTCLGELIAAAVFDINCADAGF